MGKITFEETGGKKKLTYIAKEKAINLTYVESQQMFRRMVEKGRSGVFMADVEGSVFYVNHAFAQLLGYGSKDDIVGTNLADILFRNMDERNGFLKRLNELGVVKDFEVAVKHQDGREIVLSVTSNTMENDEGEVIGIEGFVQDVTEKAQFDDEMMTEMHKLEQLLEFSEVVSSIKAFDDLVENVVGRVAKILEAQKCSLMLINEKMNKLEVKGAVGASDTVVKEAKLKLGEPIAGVVAGEGKPLLVKNIEYDKKYQRANRPRYFGRSFMIVPIKLGMKVFGVINVADKNLTKGLQKGSRLNYEEVFDELDLRILCTIAREVSVALDNVKLFEELNALAMTDPLVHIYNYRQFSTSLDYEIKRCRRSKCHLCIAMIDVDDFKSYNDSFGHQEGDALLKTLGRLFEENLREVDVVCRYAGDEFTIILPNTDIAGARQAAEKVLEAVRGFKFKKKVTLSIGIAAYRDDLTQYQLISHADKALYQAKNKGKNRVCAFEEA